MARPIPIFALLCSMAALVGCGSIAHRTVNPQAALDAAAAHPVKSADVAAEVTIQVQGVDRLNGPLRLRVDGPYVAGSASSFPSFDWRAKRQRPRLPGGRAPDFDRRERLPERLWRQLPGWGRAAATTAGGPAMPTCAAGSASPGRSGDGNEGRADCARIRAPLRGGGSRPTWRRYSVPWARSDVGGARHGRGVRRLRRSPSSTSCGVDAQLTVPPQEQAMLERGDRRPCPRAM